MTIERDSTPDRDNQRRIMAQKRASERDIAIPACANPERRAACEADVFLFLTTYFGAKFYTPWTETQREMINAILYAASYGGDQAIAAPRGDGKTTIAECVIAFALLVGLLRFPVIVAATGTDASQILDNIKYLIESSDTLAEDFPEVVAPIRALEGATSRGNMQTVAGKRTRIEWGVTRVVLPDVAGSKCAGSVLLTRGLDAAIRGRNIRGLRPDFALIDDPETRESAASELQVKQRERTLDQDIAGLAGQGKALARVALVTILNTGCLADRLTDSSIKPSWSGKRYKMLAQKPAREDLWEEYMAVRRAGQESGKDKDGREALQFYLDRREEMDAGAIVSNPYRAITRKLKDGSPIEVSTIQHCYNFIADKGLDAFLCEYQNDPPEESGPTTSGITDLMVRGRLNKRPRGQMPADTLALTAFIDIGDYACHWAAVAWAAGATGYVIDYGVEEVYQSETGADRAIINALYRWRERTQAAAYTLDCGEVRAFDKILIDSGYRETAVFQFVREVGGNPYRASKGFGEGHRSSPFSGGQANSINKKIGNHWYESRQRNHNLWLVGMDGDFWKRFCHDRFLTPTFNEDLSIRRGSLSLWGDKPKEHFSFSKHIVAEIEEEEFIAGKGVKRAWSQKNANNHWLDCMYGNCVAADMAGVKLFAPTAAGLASKLNPTSWFQSQRDRRRTA